MRQPRAALPASQLSHPPQSTSPSAADKTVSDALPAASATAPPVTARARTPEKEAAPPVPALQRPTAAPEAAEASIPAAASVTNPAPADSGLIGNALESLQQAGPEKPEADVPRPAPAAAAAASIESADASSSLKAAGAPEIAPMAAAPAREDSAEKRAEPALAPPLQRPAGKPVRRRPPPREAGSKNGAPATPGAYDLAVAALATERPLPGKVVKTSAGGVVVRVQAGFQGFLPWSKMLPHRNLVVLERERAAQAALDPPEDPSAQQEARLQLRRDAMAGLQDNRVMVYVHEVKRQEEEVYFKTMLSEKGPQSKPLLDYPPYQTEVLQEMLGERVDARVRKVTEYGAFLTFPVEVYAGYSLEMFGLLHRSKMGDLSLESLQEGQQVTAYLLTLDVVKGHVEMSAEPPTLPMPINQTLEDLILSSGAAKQGKEGSPDEEVESMPEAMDVCRELLLSGAITEATPGRRLQGRAFSPEVQVFMARNEGEAVATGESGPKRYTLLARARNEVQEIEVESGLERDEMKTALGLALSTVLAVM
ncbi:hypothetical protein COCSUDRAFT_43380 [Coccomyxa subellipsoidea C-169]|uniref:S1 motif domain-containing protein n=1 Tax=Coccomyxa subellipsoidea (strain C-169) TaxID=574566 RepID=I0YRJ5_COCSC|nr:hypothetical protein COCSUDRAFT_43380 [Coccomyxa subellipsoidea C-169]EIE21014.1 hypothetical protein COCSUDRAFT_43380 [Coccomyxa subellipsoidea C-169]|eukprot:XP_005645558.1 hypothetical protein COCSUDRAFT_43380 [Coccomyxa subellipsoidea C-169]